MSHAYPTSRKYFVLQRTRLIPSNYRLIRSIQFSTICQLACFEFQRLFSIHAELLNFLKSRPKMVWERNKIIVLFLGMVVVIQLGI